MLYFKGLGVRNLQYEMRIFQKIHNKASKTVFAWFEFLWIRRYKQNFRDFRASCFLRSILPHGAIKFWVPLANIESLQPSLLDTFAQAMIESCFTLPISLETLVSTMCWGWKEIIIPLFSSLASNNGFICSVNLSLFNDI